MKNKKQFMKNKVLAKTIQTALNTCPLDCVVMLLIQLIITLLPTLALVVNRMFVNSLNAKKGLMLSIISLGVYGLLLLLQRILNNWYHHYYLMYFSLLKFEKKIKQTLFDICNKMQLSDYNDADIVNKSIRAKNASINILRVYQATVEMFCAILGTLVMGTVLTSINDELATIIVMIILVSVIENVFIILQNKQMLYRNTQKEKEEDEISNILLNANTFKEIKILHCVDFCLYKWLKVAEELKKSENLKYIRVLLVSIAMRVFTLAGIGSAYFILFSGYTKGEISIAEFSVSITAFNSVSAMMKNLFEVLGGMSQFIIMVKPYYEFENLATMRMSNISDDREEFGDIIVKNLAYKYPGTEQYALKDISFKIREGQRVAIVGENGSGKTTLLKILLKLYEPTKGVVEYLYRPIQKIETNIHNQVSEVPQEFNCYAISLKDNIVFGDSVRNSYIKELLDSVGLQDLEPMIDDIMDRQFDGIELSGGQKQRIAIIRACHKKGVLFAFDEPTSAIDPLQESMIYDKLQEMAKGNTTIFISHRLALTRNSDLIIVMKHGHIHEIGSHIDLLNMKGEYYKMWNAQAGLYIETN